YINKVVTDFTAKPLLKDIFIDGNYVDKPRSLDEIKAFCQSNLENLWDEYKRSLNPQEYPVDLSQNLYESKIDLISEIRTKIRNRGLH
ncbi:MAG: nicotinate phosphoribosyltransferase, partial [Lactobacillus crispatus]|nr:nicotinate phosphoribosyltransferase [Lactobacillus crispatus]